MKTIRTTLSLFVVSVLFVASVIGTTTPGCASLFPKQEETGEQLIDLAYLDAILEIAEGRLSSASLLFEDDETGTQLQRWAEDVSRVRGTVAHLRETHGDQVSVGSVEAVASELRTLVANANELAFRLSHDAEKRQVLRQIAFGLDTALLVFELATAGS